MQSEKNSRLDTRELKAQLLKNVGQECFKKYFHSLNKFINQKLSKSEFDKSCYRLLGRENLPLHNQIIKAILRNACSAKTGPSQSHNVGPANKSSTCSLDGRGQHRSSVSTVWSNGVVPTSPRKSRSTIRDRGDRIRPLVPNGELPHKIQDFDGDEMEKAKGVKYSRSRLIAPLGIPYCSASMSGPHNVLPVTHIGDYHRCVDLDGLPDSETLKRRMEQNVDSRDMGVTLECANVLNTMVDVYLKRLICSSLELVGSRSNAIQKQQIHGKPVNGIWPSNHMHTQNSEPVSLLDFKVAMELNPQQLGEKWPLLLEKISMQGFEE